MDNAKIIKFLDSVSEFETNLVSELLKPDAQQGARDVYFLDNQGNIKNCLEKLKAIMDNPNMDSAVIQEAEKHYNVITDTITEYKKTLVISDDVTEQDVITAYNKENLDKAMQANSTTKKLMEQMDTIKKEQEPTDIYNYMIMVDDSVSLLNIPDNADINAYLAKLPEDMIQGKLVRLFKISATEIPLTRKTVLSTQVNDTNYKQFGGI